MTPQRARALAYLRSCIDEGVPISITEMVRIGAGADRWSAKRCLRWAAREIDGPDLPLWNAARRG